MNWTRLLCVCLTAVCAATASGVTLFTFGGDFVSPGANGAPDSLNRMDPASAGSVMAIQTPVGDGSIGFNGGLFAFASLLYAIGNDSNGVATLYSMGTDGQNLQAVSAAFNNSGDATGIVFQNGLAAIGGTFYAIGAGASFEALYSIGSGTATQIQTLDTLNGTYAGLAWDPAQGVFYGLVANGNSKGIVGDYLVQFALSGPVSVVANLTSLDGAPIGTHLGGLANAGGGMLYDIYTNPVTFSGELEQINANGIPSAVTLYDSQIPLAQNAGLAVATPEPETGVEVGAALLLLGGILRRCASRIRNS